MFEYDEGALCRIADAQAQVVTRAQLRRLGLVDWHVRARVRGRRWRLVGARCVVLHRGPLDQETKRWIAVLEHPGSALCAATVLADQGVQGFWSSRVHLLVRRGTRTRRFPWLKVHESRRFVPERDVHPAARPTRVRVERAVIDQASWSDARRRGCALVAAAVQQRLTTAERLLEELDQAGAIRFHRVLRITLHDVAGGSHALSELDLLELCLKAGLPVPERQVVRRDSTGRRRYLDAELVLPDGTRLVLEADGAGHRDVDTWWDDLMRQNDVVIDGAVVLRFPAIVQRLRPDLVIGQLRRIAARHTVRAA